MINYTDLLKKRRSIRDFEDKKIPAEIINEILHDACLAPSACNIQPWRFVVVQVNLLAQATPQSVISFIITVDE